jgi:hypothetical protein
MSLNKKCGHCGRTIEKVTDDLIVVLAGYFGVPVNLISPWRHKYTKKVACTRFPDQVGGARGNHRVQEAGTR